MGVTEETLTVLGMDPSKFKQTLKNKKLCNNLDVLVSQATEVIGNLEKIKHQEGRILLDFAMKLKSVTPATKPLVALVFQAPGIQSPEQIVAGTVFLNTKIAANEDVTEDEVKTVAGVGVVVSDKEIVEAVSQVFGASEELLNEKKHAARGLLMRQVKTLLPFASGVKVAEVIAEELNKKFGEEDQAALKQKKKEQLAKQRKEKKKQEREAKLKAEQEKAEAAASQAASQAANTPEGGESEQIVTPWEVEGGDEGINYDRLIEDFGCQKLTGSLVDKIKEMGYSVHRFLRRSIFFSHRDLEKILEMRKEGKSFYLYTGRGPSSDAMHLGHLIPFLFTQYLQEVFDVPLVIQMTDDEKFLFKDNLTLDADPKTGVKHMLKENVKDIIACGFNPEKTFIFSDLEFVGGAFYENIVKIQKKVTLNQVQGCFGFTGTHNIGQIAFMAIQAAPSFPTSFPGLLQPTDACLIPCAIDQDPYFRLTRDVAPRLGYKKPALIHSKFFPAMSGPKSKMSSSTGSVSTVFLTDTPKQINDKVHRYAFSGAPSTLEDHKKNGADTDIDVAYQYLTFFLEDDEKLADIQQKYSKGEITTFDVKSILVKELQELVAGHQKARAEVTDETVKHFMDFSRFQKKTHIV